MTSLLPLLLAFSLQQGPDSVVARATKAITPLTDSTALQLPGFTPFQGQHWLSIPRMLTMVIGNAPVDIDSPTFLMYLPLNGKLTPVGVAYTIRIGGQAAPPTTFADRK